MKKGGKIEFVYGWLCFTLALFSATQGALAFNQGRFVNSLLLFIAGGLFFYIDVRGDRRGLLMLAGGLVLMVCGLSGLGAGS